MGWYGRNNRKIKYKKKILYIVKKGVLKKVK